MVTIKVYKAKSSPSIQVQSSVIEIIEELPDSRDIGTLEEHRACFEKQAALIADALHRSLPGGTLWALLVEMMKRQHSLLVIKP